MKAIIPIGGRGTRMRPVTFTSNKHFIPVGNHLLIHYPIQTIIDAGITEIAITYNPGQLKYAKEILGDGSKWNANFTYILQPEPKGLANIVEVCADWVGDDPFILHLGDNIFVDGIHEILDYFLAEKPDGLVTMVEHPENSRLGVPVFDDNNRLIEYLEKPENPPNKFAVPGLYLGNKNFFKAYQGTEAIKPSARGEYEIVAPFQWLIDHKFRVDVKEYKGKWLDPGKFNDWLETNQYLLDFNTRNQTQSSIDESVRIEGRVSIGSNCIIKNSTIRGPVDIGDNCHIENTFVGPFTSVFHNSRLVNSHIENSVLMENVTIEHVDQPIDSSIIGPHAQIIKDTSHPNLELFLGELSKIVL